MAICVVASGCRRPEQVSPKGEEALRTYAVTGVVQEIHASNKSVVIAHEKIPGFMPAMTMSFEVRETNALASLAASDQLAFRLNVKGEESWIDAIRVLKKGAQPMAMAGSESKPQEARDRDGMFTFTNELGQAVNLKDFAGEALAMNFIFTRCPLPNACPRESQNFANASRKLASMQDAPTNWHFLSISIDSDYDTPEVLRSYAKRYGYNSNHWSFLTGPRRRVDNLAKTFGFDYQPDKGLFTHGFRTVIIGPDNRVVQMYPVTGDLSDAIVQDMLKALGATNQTEP